MLVYVFEKLRQHGKRINHRNSTLLVCNGGKKGDGLTMQGKKERNIKDSLVTRLTTECVINLGFVGLLRGLVLFFCHMQSYLFKEDV